MTAEVRQVPDVFDCVSCFCEWLLLLVREICTTVHAQVFEEMKADVQNVRGMSPPCV